MSRAWITQLPDGRTNYKFHQSWLGDTDLCLERARKGLMGEMLDPPSDATAAGTAMHAGAEHALIVVRDGGWTPSVDDLIDVAQATFTELISDPTFLWKKRKARGARNYITLAVEMFYEQILPKLDPWHVELSFGPYVFYEDDRIVIELGGTIDYVDRRWGLMDWKTGAAHSWAGKDWEKSRWAIQPTVYTWAWFQWLIENGFAEPEMPMPFRFVVMRDDGAVQKVLVQRRSEDWVWLERKVLAIVAQIERDLVGPWPLNDQHALCSEKWCPAWHECKGAAVHTSWPK